mgnify:FL=1
MQKESPKVTTVVVKPESKEHVTTFGRIVLAKLLYEYFLSKMYLFSFNRYLYKAFFFYNLTQQENASYWLLDNLEGNGKNKQYWLNKVPGQDQVFGTPSN